MVQFKPVLYTNNHTHKGDVKIYDTYRDLRKDLIDHLEHSVTGQVEVFRSRRGQFGEWFEHWQFNAERKPTIIKSGWM